MGIETEENKIEGVETHEEPENKDNKIELKTRKIKNVRSLVKELKNVIIQKYESKP